jgi:NADH-quinone oxidoreductase subunit J
MPDQTLMIFSTVLFYLLALVLVVAAFRVITATSPVTGVLHLILVFFTASMIWMLLGAEFLSLLLVLVYVGAVMVLFLFVVMMLDVRMDALRAGLKTYLPMGIVIGLVMVLEMGFVLVKTWFNAGPAAPIADDFDNTRALGQAMYTDYVLAVQVGGVILLVGMVAAIALTLRKRSDVKRNRPSDQVRVRAQDRMRLVSIPSQTEAPSPVAEAKQENRDKQ